MQSLETKSSRPRPKSFETETETETRSETFETETSKNGSLDASRDRDQVSRLNHWKAVVAMAFKKSMLTVSILPHEATALLELFYLCKNIIV